MYNIISMLIDEHDIECIQSKYTSSQLVDVNVHIYAVMLNIMFDAMSFGRWRQCSVNKLNSPLYR